jgi:hypothetical protein
MSKLVSRVRANKRRWAVSLIRTLASRSLAPPFGKAACSRSVFRAVGEEQRPRSGRRRFSARRVYLERNASALANVFIAPDSVQRLRAMSERQLGYPFSEAIMRSAAQMPAELRVR